MAFIAGRRDRPFGRPARRGSKRASSPRWGIRAELFGVLPPPRRGKNRFARWLIVRPSAMVGGMETSEPAPSVEREVVPGLALGQVHLKPRKARPFYGRHPWVLDSAIEHIEGLPPDGSIVDLLTDQGKFVARGLFNSRSKIRVRLYSWDLNEPLADEFWRRKLTEAIALRRDLDLMSPHSAARLLFSEADGLSGLIVDRFGEYLSVQTTGLGIAQRLPMLVEILAELTRPKGILLRTEKGTPAAEGIELRDGVLWGEAPSGPVFIEEHGLKYGVDLIEGQKTGFYLDQRDNRRVAAQYLTAGRVLDVFCYSGGFALNAVKHAHATDVLAVDSSPRALALAKANAELNGVTQIKFELADGFDVLEQLNQPRQKFSSVILDPPKFARSRSGVEEALRAYHRINRLAVDLLVPGGILVTCSCSGHVQREDFLFMLSGVAQQAGRTIQVLEQRGPGPDHPVNVNCLETEYLKCFVCRVA